MTVVEKKTDGDSAIRRWTRSGALEHEAEPPAVPRNE
jgi:hypothetical protein